ncbi:MAG: hypothetical protein II396_02505 [Methanobrevibacter sp.]|nr:hypothetical protein [Methanobrevibacter sp.]
MKCWKDQTEAPSKFMVKSSIKPTDEWLHAFYYFNDEIPSENSFEETMQQYLNFEMEMVLKNKSHLFNE